MKKNKVLLIICDGYGVGKIYPGNAIELAKKPVLESIAQKALYSELVCSGEAVGLPKGQMGNSEVGHLNLGAGRTVYQDITKIDKAVEDGSFYTRPVLEEALQKASLSRLHLMGLFSDGGVHSDVEHLKALVRAGIEKKIPEIVLHLFLDGRDTEPRSALRYLDSFHDFLQDKPEVKIATVSGRYYAMDRDKRWDRVKKAYDAIVHGQGLQYLNAESAIKAAYDRGEDDEFVSPSVILFQNEAMKIAADDVMIFFNFRADRARELSVSLTDPDFDSFDRNSGSRIKHFFTMVPYDEKFTFPVLFSKDNLTDTLGEVISKAGKTQLRIAETEKYAHVTFFFNGGREKPFLGEDRAMIPSLKVATYDLEPSMAAVEVCNELIRRYDRGYDFILLNFANLDMVGHTGKLEAAVKAVETVDSCIGQLVHRYQDDYHIIITSDHGNAEEMLDSEGNVQTAHTLNPVPLWLMLSDQRKLKLKTTGLLSDLADLVLSLLDIEKPDSMKESRLVS
jgi:2,3-bisphosphoglycerate-independent phosphoglycerate mutase